MRSPALFSLCCLPRPARPARRSPRRKGKAQGGARRRRPCPTPGSPARRCPRCSAGGEAAKRRRGARRQAEDPLLRRHGLDARAEGPARRALAGARAATRPSRASSSARCSCWSRRSTKRSATPWPTATRRPSAISKCSSAASASTPSPPSRSSSPRYPNDPRYTPDVMFRLAELYYERSSDDQSIAMRDYEEALKKLDPEKNPDPAARAEDRLQQVHRALHPAAHRLPHLQAQRRQLVPAGLLPGKAGRLREGPRLVRAADRPLPHLDASPPRPGCASASTTSTPTTCPTP